MFSIMKLQPSKKKSPKKKDLSISIQQKSQQILQSLHWHADRNTKQVALGFCSKKKDIFNRPTQLWPQQFFSPGLPELK